MLSNGIDANGRLIGFVYAGTPPTADGASVFLDNAGVDGSVNAQLLQAGLVYPAFYGTLPATLREHLAVKSRAAREAGSGIWARSTADPDGPATITNLASLETKSSGPSCSAASFPTLRPATQPSTPSTPGSVKTLSAATTRSSGLPSIRPSRATSTTSSAAPGSRSN